MSLCDLLDDVLDSMTEFSNPPPPPPLPPHPGTQVILGPSLQSRPISLLRCTSVPVDDESLTRYTKCARTFVRRIEGGIGMWGLNRFMTALRSGGGENEGGDGTRVVCRVSSVCTLLALRDGEDSYGASLAERLTSVKVDVRTLLEEVGIGLRELGAGVGDEQKEAVLVVKRDVEWERNKLERLAELVEMLLASLIPAIEECLVDGEREEPGMRAFVPEGVVGRAGSSFTFEGGGGGAGEGAYYYHRPEDVGIRESNLSLEKTKREPASYSMITERSMATNTIWKRGSRTATPSPTDLPDRPQLPQRSTSFQIPPQPIRDRSQLPPSSTSSIRASTSLRASYSRQNAESLTFKPPQLDRLSTITANTTATGDTFMYLARSMRVAAEVEGIREEELGIGSPGNWGGSEYDFDQGSGGAEGKKKWWRGRWGGKKNVARGKDRSVVGFDGGNKELAVAPAGPKKKGWKRFLCFGGEE
ncbi:hypothetical protein BGX38DRAFT_1146512 [Terfezia claveryi]|nr:hypothetical protein BGX38DRAFT_1146512 [Terfezia claveryi]